MVQLSLAWMDEFVSLLIARTLDNLNLQVNLPQNFIKTGRVEISLFYSKHVLLN